jgi:hypothetical protein
VLYQSLPYQTTKVLSTNKLDNGICDDGEFPFIDKDCQVTASTLFCKDGDCLFNYIWAARILVMLCIGLALFRWNNNTIIIIIGVLLLLVIMYTPSLSQLVSEKIASWQPPAPTGEVTEAATPNNPAMAVAAVIGIVFIAYWYWRKK